MTGKGSYNKDGKPKEVSKRLSREHEKGKVQNMNNTSMKAVLGEDKKITSKAVETASSSMETGATVKEASEKGDKNSR